MRVLFVGIGLTHYYNQVLNKLSKQPEIELYNLADANGRGHGGAGVYETTDAVEFKVVYRPQVVFKKFSDYRYHGFRDFLSLLSEIRPDIIVVSEMFSEFIFSTAVWPTVKEFNIKIIMKNIPFRLLPYKEAKERIISGAADHDYTPWFVVYLRKLLIRARANVMYVAAVKLVKLFKTDKWYRRHFGRDVQLKLLELKKRQYELCDAHADYVEAAYPLFGSYGIPKEKIFITYNSPDTDFLFEVRKKIEALPALLIPNTHRLLHVGRLIEWKRVDMLIKSFVAIKKEFSDAELLIIGTGPLEDSLKKLAKQLDVETSVKFIGGVYKPEELGRYLLASTVYVLAGMGGISINDAMVFGKPIICSICDGTEKKLVYDSYNGFYFKDGDEVDLTDKIRKIFNNPELAKTMGNNSTEIIRNDINIHTVIRGYLAAFHYVLNKK